MDGMWGFRSATRARGASGRCRVPLGSLDPHGPVVRCLGTRQLVRTLPPLRIGWESGERVPTACVSSGDPGPGFLPHGSPPNAKLAKGLPDTMPACGRGLYGIRIGEAMEKKEKNFPRRWRPRATAWPASPSGQLDRGSPPRGHTPLQPCSHVVVRRKCMLRPCS